MKPKAESLRAKESEPTERLKSCGVGAIVKRRAASHRIVMTDEKLRFALPVRKKQMRTSFAMQKRGFL